MCAFDPAKGFGFIRCDNKEVNKGHDLFVHYRQIIQRGGFKTLREGDQVEFSLCKNTKGLCAYEVVIINAAEVENEVHSQGD